MNRKGFTLIELMIVIAIIAIIAAIAIPGLLRARISANEGSAIGTLRTVSTSQAQFQSSANIDQDTDGTGEFAVINELTGTYAMRTSGIVANPAYITKALATGTNLHGNKSGYLFKIYLPAAAGGPITDLSTGALTGSATNADYQEVKWRSYSWPTSAKTSGNRAFAVDQAGEVYATANIDTAQNPIWSGSTTVPAFNDACLSGSGTETTTMDYSLTKGTGTNAQTWTPAN